MTVSASSQTSSLPTSISELVLPDRPSLSQTLTSLKKSRLSIHNRLTSIDSDSEFISAVSAANNLPLIANERCGGWYVDPAHKAGSVYFKSTDGHQGQWKFSSRRLNTNLLAILGKYGGGVVVDSTRRGKSMPDALSKTIPIWAAVVNRVLYPDARGFHALSTPEDVVGRSEHAQIESRLGLFVEDLLALDLDWDKLRSLLLKPIRIAFITRQTTVLKVQQYDDAHTLICCSASRHERDDGDNYVQGAGDDTENWAYGLTSQLYWQYRDRLLSEPNEKRLVLLIQELTHSPLTARREAWLQIWLKDNPTSLYIGKTSSINLAETRDFDGVVLCDILAQGIVLPGSPSRPPPVLVELHCSQGKLGAKALREKLPKLDAFMIDLLRKVSVPKILVLCSTGRDLSVGTVLAILCRWTDDDGKYRSELLQGTTKTIIRKRLACVTETIPAANPSRATLQSVNTYLMGYTM